MALTCKEVDLSDFRSLVRARWSKLNGDDLDAIEMEPELLVDIVQERYDLDGDEADKQVHDFEIKNRLPDFDSCKRKRTSHA